MADVANINVARVRMSFILIDQMSTLLPNKERRAQLGKIILKGISDQHDDCG